MRWTAESLDCGSACRARHLSMSSRCPVTSPYNTSFVFYIETEKKLYGPGSQHDMRSVSGRQI